MKDLKFFLTIGGAIVLIYFVVMAIIYGILIVNALLK